jgi:hypothetical protein
MKAGARQVLVLAAAVSLALPLLADEAKTRSSGGSSSAAGARHHARSAPSGGGSSGRSSGYAVPRSGGSYGRSTPSSSHGRTLTGPESRHPRAGTGTSWRYPYGGGYYGGYGYPYYGGHWGYPYYGYGYYPYYGYSPYWSWGFGYYPYSGLYFDSWWWTPPYYGAGVYVRSSSDTGSVRILVDQPKARVYVDGYYAGEVDDFDGMFQRLYVAPGEHDITVKLEGYLTHNFAVHVPQEGTLKLRWEMQSGEGHDGTGDPTLAPPRREARAPRYDSGEDRYGEREAERDRYREGDRDREREAESDRSVSVERAPSADAGVGLGSVRFEVRPSDASIYVDGSFRGTGRDLRSLELRAGPHRIEIVKPGYRTYERELTVDAAAYVDLAVELEK